MSTRCQLLVALVALGVLQPSLSSQQNASAGEKRAALISELAGTASVRENASGPSSPAERFYAMAEGTILEVGRDSRAIIVLARGKRFALAAGARATVHGDRLGSTSGQIDELPTLPALPPLVALDAQAPKTLGGVRLRSTVIPGLSPSNGSALASRATLRFTPAPGVATYRVEIEDEKGGVILGVQTASPEVPVPPDILQAGANYYWTVRTIDRPGPQARGSAEFRTLRAVEVQARDALKRRLDDEGGTSSIALLAAIDRHLGLHDEALEGFRAALARAPGDKALRQAVTELEGGQGIGGR